MMNYFPFQQTGVLIEPLTVMLTLNNTQNINVQSPPNNLIAPLKGCKILTKPTLFGPE